MRFATVCAGGVGIWIDGVTGSGTCYDNDGLSDENTPHSHCKTFLSVFLVAIVDCVE